tara:strand:+ start:8338 stop:8739 length:402 start_codon:yes stop_codon:yes gene_type:complete
MEENNILDKNNNNTRFTIKNIDTDSEEDEDIFLHNICNDKKELVEEHKNIQSTEHIDSLPKILGRFQIRTIANISNISNISNENLNIIDLKDKINELKEQLNSNITYQKDKYNSIKKYLMEIKLSLDELIKSI